MRRVSLDKFPDDLRDDVVKAAVEIDGSVVTLRPGDYLRLRAAAFKPGDAIAAATKSVGIPPCSGCRDRQRRLNAAWRNRLTKG